MNGKHPNKWEGTHLYGRNTPGRRARTASLVREEAVAKLLEEREKRKQLAEEKRRSLSVGSLSSSPAMSNKSKRSTSRGGSPVPSTANTTDNNDNRCSQPATNVEEKMQTDQEKGSASTAGATGNGTTGPDGAAAGPDTPGHGMDPAQAAFFLAMEARLKRASQKSVEDVTGLFQRNIERIDNNTKAIADMRSQNSERDKKMTERLDDLEAKAITREQDMEQRIRTALERNFADTAISAKSAAAAIGPQNLSVAQITRREAAYHLARRSLKAWPVDGEDLEDAFKVFLRNKLKLPDSTVRSLGKIEVQKRPGKVAEQKLEVLAVFECKEERDAVKAAGVNLAGQENVGLLIHVPGHLLDNLHALNSVGYNIKLKNQGVRRSVKFDDENLDIFMDIRINNQWKRITPAEARQVANSIPRAQGSTTRNLSVEDLSALVQGEAVEGINVVEVPDNE